MNRISRIFVLQACFSLAFSALVLATEPPIRASRSVVGTARALQIVPELAAATEEAGRGVWRHEIRIDGAAFLKAHFVEFNLLPGDALTLRSRTGKVVENLTRHGPKDMGSFWGLSAFGDTLFLEFDFERPYDSPPFRIDGIMVGDPEMLSAVGVPVAGPWSSPIPDDGTESICFPAEFEDVICYQGDAGKWANVMASVGVMTAGSTVSLWCSGSNVSSSNLLLTNEHCIQNQAKCDNSEFVFKYYRTGCNDGSPPTVDWQGFRCDQVLVQSPFNNDCESTLDNLDFTLASVIGDPAATFGWVEPDPVPLTDGEAIYIVQHPLGVPHEITHGFGTNVDVDGTVLRYYNTLDTNNGSSGSPIFREADDKLIGLHHCGGCSTSDGNRGMLMSDIYPLIAPFLPHIFSDGFESGDTSAWPEPDPPPPPPR